MTRLEMIIVAIIVSVVCCCVCLSENELSFSTGESVSIGSSVPDTYCDSCGKSCTYKNEFSHIGISIIIDSVDGDEDLTAFYREMLCEYELGKTYNICWACWLRSLGVRP